jgi:YidC/Oxa1 family membrane protein insertase
MISSLFHSVLYQPIFNIFVFLYNYLGHDVGVVILLLTILVRLILYPLTNSSIKAQRSLQELQPKMDALKKQYAADKTKQTQEIMALYKNNKVNPFTSCLPMLVQLPILIALYMVLRDGLASANLTSALYSFVANPGTINPVSLGFFNMAKPNFILAILAGLAQFWQAKTMSRKSPPKEAGAGSKDEAMMSMMNKQMLYFMPAMTVLIGLSLPAGLTLYWFFSTLLMALQQVWVNKKPDINKDDKPQGNIIEGKVEEIK